MYSVNLSDATYRAVERLAASRHTSVEDALENLILEEAAGEAAQQEELRVLLGSRIRSATEGNKKPAAEVFDRLTTKYSQQAS